MPQMMPLNWLILFIIFTMIFFMFNSMIYFNFLYKPKKDNLNFKKMSNNWKW